MVSHPLALAPGDAESWLVPLESQYGAERAALLRQALDYLYAHGAKIVTPSGTPLPQHALATAAILANMRFDVETLAAALLAGLDEQALKPEVLTRQFGDRLAALVLGAARLYRMDALFSSELASEASQSESLRQMLLAMADDIRVVLIKLAERVQTLREMAQAAAEARIKVAYNARELYAPLANRLGIWQLKWELEDLACRYLEPETYRHIAQLLNERRLDRERYIEQVLAKLNAELKQAGLENFKVAGRPKHIASILAKMRSKGLAFEDIYDVRAVRVLVPEVKDCYHVLGIVHSLWQPIPGQFDDYISRPKRNGYQSLHTAVIGPEGKALEVQIRTFAMHQDAELGMAAHWRYKEGGQGAALADKVAWLRQLLAWKDELAAHADLAQQLRHELFQDEVFVLTPKGKVIALPAGATPIDFAYAVHTELGHRCRGAKVDGQLVPLDTPLKTGQCVQILTVKEGGPSRDWLNPHLGFIRTSRARARVRQWFKQLDYAIHVQEGREQLERELNRLNLSNVNLEQLAAKLGFDKPEDLYASLGRGDLGSGQLIRSLQELFLPPPEKPLVHARKRKAALASVLVEGEANLLTRMAGCCKPAPPDPIVGFITQGRGVSIHRADCNVVRRLPPTQQGRLLQASWEGDGQEVFAVEVEVIADDRPGLLKDISERFAQEKINVIRVHTQSQHKTARMEFTLEVRNVEQLTRLLVRAAHVRGVSLARRK